MKYSDFIRYGEDMLGKSPDDDWRLLPGWAESFARVRMAHQEEIERGLFFGVDPASIDAPELPSGLSHVHDAARYTMGLFSGGHFSTSVEHVIDI